MSPFRLVLALTLLAPLSAPGTPSSSSASVASQRDAPSVASAKEGWPARLAALATPRPLSATFTESRTTPLKKLPVVVTGTVRIDPARGLSLAYDQPHAPIVILDDKGLLLRHPDGREQSAPPSAEPSLRLLRALFAFDLATLEKSYAVATTDDSSGTWFLVFTRRPDSNAPYRELILRGEAKRLTGIRLEKSERQNIDIALAPPQLDPFFTPEGLARYFR